MLFPAKVTMNARKGSVCSNCGREYGPKDGIRFRQLKGTSLVEIRALFLGHFKTVPCPACSEAVSFEPAVMFVDPPVAMLSGGDAVDERELAGIADKMKEQAAEDGLLVDVSTFETQDQLI